MAAGHSSHNHSGLDRPGRQGMNKDRAITEAKLLAVELSELAEDMAELADERRRILVMLRHKHAMSCVQIAQALEMSPARVSQIINAAPNDEDPDA